LTLAGAWPRALAPLAWMALIFYLSAEPPRPGPAWASIVAHFIEYAVLAALWTWALAPYLGGRALAVSLVVAAVYAVTDEYHQSFVPGRDADPVDVAVDWAGAAIAVVTVRAWLQARGRASTRATHSRRRG